MQTERALRYRTADNFNSDYKASNIMTDHKEDIYFQDVEGTIAAKTGDKVGFVLNKPPSFLINNLRFYTIVFSYGNEYQQYLTQDDKGRLCFVTGDRDSLKVYDSYEKAKQVMDELSKNSFPNKGILQVCSFNLNAVGEPSGDNTGDYLKIVGITQE